MHPLGYLQPLINYCNSDHMTCLKAFNILHDIVYIIIIILYFAAVADAKYSSKYPGAAVPPVCPGVHEPSVS